MIRLGSTPVVTGTARLEGLLALRARADRSATATVVVCIVMEMMRYAQRVWPMILVEAEMARFGLSLSDIELTISLPVLVTAGVMLVSGVAMDVVGVAPLLRLLGAGALLEGALVFAAWQTGVWWPVIVGRGLLGICEASDQVR